MNSRSLAAGSNSRLVKIVLAAALSLPMLFMPMLPSSAAPPMIKFGENIIQDVVVADEQGSKNVTSAWTKKQTGLFTQRIDLSILADSIDKGNGLKYVFSGCVGVDKQDSLKAIFLTDNDAAIGVAVLLADDTGPIGKIVEKSVSGTIPQGTRAIMIEAKVSVNDTTTANPMLVLAPNVNPKAAK